MSAPLYSRYCRYANREAKKFEKSHPFGKSIPLWKRPDTRVYSLTERASYEAGWWSTSEPKEILRAMQYQFMPAERIWIECDFTAFQNGAAHLAIDSTLNGPDAKTPIRIGFMIERQDSIRDIYEAHFEALVCYVCPGGTFSIPTIYSVWSDAPLSFLQLRVGDKRDSFSLMALGGQYVAKHRTPDQGGVKELLDRMLLIPLNRNKPMAELPWYGGATRMIIAIFTAALSARAGQHASEPPMGTTAPSKAATNAHRRVIEVDLFLRERPKKPGRSIRASIRHIEGHKKGLHKVAAHYAYRAREGGGDPTQCTKVDKHEFEALFGTKTQVCIYCGQKRWLKKAHERGDAKYGVVPQKTYNVRAGQIPSELEFTHHKKEF